MAQARHIKSKAEMLGDDQPAKRGRGRLPGEGGRAPTPTRDRLNAAQADLAEVRAAKMRGELVERAAVVAEWSRIVIDLRAGLLALPSRLGSRLGLTPAQVAEADAEVRAVLTALAGADDAARG